VDWMWPVQLVRALRSTSTFRQFKK
jgi:hypothetical protein